VCDVTPLPHLLTLTPPWDAPLQWLLFASSTLVFVTVFVALYLAIGFMLTGRRRRWVRAVGHASHIPPLFKIGLGLATAGVLPFLYTLAIYLLVIWPASDRLEAWYTSEHARLLALTCDRTAFYAAYGSASHDLATWGLISVLVGMIGGVLTFAGGLAGAVGAINHLACREAARYPA
jgi:hypothetical protein